MFATHPSVVRLGLRSDLPVDSPSGQSCRCDGDRRGAARSVGAVTVVPIDGVDFPALGRYEKDYATYGYDYGTRNPEQTYSTPD
jgi:hypothetical protein